jgi:hypothetical protein
MTETRRFGHTRRPRCELDIRNLIRMEALIFQRVALPAIFHNIIVSPHALVPRHIDAPLRIVHKHDIPQRRHEFAFEPRAREIRHEVRQQRDILARVFSRQVRFGADYEVRGGEMV